MSGRPNYLKALLRHLEDNPPEPGAVEHVEVRHDSGCARLRGTGSCDCDPEVETGARVDERYGGEP